MFKWILCLFLYSLAPFSIFDKAAMQSLFTPFCQDDPQVCDFINRFNVRHYTICHLRNKNGFIDHYLVEKETSDFIKHEYLKAGILWEEFIHDLIRKYTKPGSSVVDIGGHIGIHTINLSRAVGKNGTVHVFEPQVKLFSELVINMRLNHCENIVFHRQALGDQNDWVEMNPTNIVNEGNTLIGKGGDRVEMVRLDNFHLDQVSLLKIDVEGYEEQVIDGARDTILRNKPVLLIEIWADNDLSRKLQKIEQLGYSSHPLSHHDYLFIPEIKPL